MVSKGGIGKSLITTNVAVALARRGKRVILVEGDPNHPIQLMLDLDPSLDRTTVLDTLKNESGIAEAIHATKVDNLSIVPLGVSLEQYLDVDPVGFVEKLISLDCDFLFIDVPFPLGNAAFMSLGICEYFVPILTEDEFSLCVEATLDTTRVARYYFRCVPLGFILNRVKSLEIFTEKFVKDLQEVLGINCITVIQEDPKVSKSYGGASSESAFVAYDRYRDSAFAKNIDAITDFLLAKLPSPEKEDVCRFIEEIIKFAEK
jgi:septum site-determining protein MinD